MNKTKIESPDTDERYDCKDNDHWKNIIIGIECRDKHCITNEK